MKSYCLRDLKIFLFLTCEICCSALFNCFKTNAGSAFVYKAELCCRTFSNIDDIAVMRSHAIIYFNDYAVIVFEISDFHERPVTEFIMCCSKITLVKNFTIGCFSTLKLVTIMDSITCFS